MLFIAFDIIFKYIVCYFFVRCQRKLPSCFPIALTIMRWPSPAEPNLRVCLNSPYAAFVKRYCLAIPSSKCFAFTTRVRYTSPVEQPAYRAPSRTDLQLAPHTSWRPLPTWILSTAGSWSRAVVFHSASEAVAVGRLSQWVGCPRNRNLPAGESCLRRGKLLS